MSTDNRFSLEDILEEQRQKREAPDAPEAEAPDAAADDPTPDNGEAPADELPEEEYAPEDEYAEDGYAGENDYDEYASQDGYAPEGEYAEDGYTGEDGYADDGYVPEGEYAAYEYAPEDEYVSGEPAADSVYYEDRYYDGEPDYAAAPEESRAERKRRKKAERARMKAEKKAEKRKNGFFARRRERKEQENFNAAEDMYYGIQLKPIDEYTRGFATGEVTMEEEGFRKLFDENTKELDDEVAENFNRLQRERRRRVADAVENAGVDLEQIDEEFGIVAPVPVSAFAGDPYARQHGITDGAAGEDLPEFQRAMLQDAETHTMEFKLDTESDSMDVKQAKVMPEVSEDSVRRILDAVDPSLEDVQKEPPKLVELAEDVRPEASNEAQTAETAEEATKTFTAPAADAEEKNIPAEAPEDTAKTQEIPVAETVAAAENEAAEPLFDEEPAAEEESETESAAARQDRTKLSAPVTDVATYRPRDLPMHVINADVLQSALLTEARAYTERDRAERERREKEDARKNRRMEDAFAPTRPEEPEETLDDYTSPADARSVSHDLRANMNAVTLRTLVTFLGTVVLFIVTQVNESGFTADTEPGAAVGYIVTSLVFLLILIGFCWKTVSGGLKALFRFRADSDSAAAVAVTAVLVQTVCAFLFETDLAKGNVHLFPAVAAGALFLNALGKLTLLRRVHANFRFVASREQKCAVQISDDVNSALRFTRGAVAGRPVVAYQQKADFLKRFLRLSYAPDDAEAASQALAPVGLLASLLLCAVALIVTGDPALSLTALAAGCCVCVSMTNLLAINLPISRLSRNLRKAGAMVSGYDAVRRISETNAVLVDSGDLFPRGSVVLNGVKAFKSENLENAVLWASILVHDLGGPLCGVFDQVLQEFENDDLPLVENATYETGSGVVGRVGGHTVLIGSRGLLAAHGVEPPESAAESRYLVQDRQILYLAVDGDLYALFSLTYKADDRRRAEIRALQENGVTLLVRAMDPNLTATFIAGLFRLDPAGIRVIGAGEEPAVDQMATGVAGRVDAHAATKGRMESMLHLITASIGVRKQVGIVVALQNAAVIIGFALVALLTFLSGVSRLSVPALFLYELFWIAVILLLPPFIARRFQLGKKPPQEKPNE